MDHCIKSFQVRIAQNFTAVNGDPGVKVRTWGTSGQYFWSSVFTPNNLISVFEILGFKNVDVYGVLVNGYVHGNFNSANKCAVVNDWNFFMQLDGNLPLISGLIKAAPNGFNLRDDANYYYISKDFPQMMVTEPIKSVKTINFYSIYAQGVGAEFLNEVSLDYGFTFTFYYKYEGEDEE